VVAACRGERPFEPSLEAAYVAESVALCALESIWSGEPKEVSLSPDSERLKQSLAEAGEKSGLSG
jgi:hypothetical protein